MISGQEKTFTRVSTEQFLSDRILSHATDSHCAAARLTGIQYVVKSAIYNLGGAGGNLADAYTPGQVESYFNLTNAVYSRYLALAAQQVYFDPANPPTVIARDPEQASVSMLELRPSVSGAAAHALAVCFTLLAALALLKLYLRSNATGKAQLYAPKEDSEVSIIVSRWAG